MGLDILFIGGSYDGRREVLSERYLSGEPYRVCVMPDIQCDGVLCGFGDIQEPTVTTEDYVYFPVHCYDRGKENQFHFMVPCDYDGNEFTSSDIIAALIDGYRK